VTGVQTCALPISASCDTSMLLDTDVHPFPLTNPEYSLEMPLARGRQSE
jgi:hypothetical protein